MRYLIAYDIASDQQRNRLVRILERYGERVQFSLFECPLTEAGEKELRARLRIGEFLTGKHGALFIYPLDDNAVRRAERYGKKLWIDEPAVIISAVDSDAEER